MKSSDINYCPLCGTTITHEQKFGRERPVCPACGWIFFADPKVAVAVLLEQNGHILLVRRVNEPFRGLWTLPAGFINADEDPARAAERECREETGLKIQVTEILDIFWGREHKRGADFVIFYRGHIDNGELVAGDDADAADWFDRSDLPPLAFKSTEYILKQF
jgi:8-oxo-dGTP diphosphatase